MGFEHHNDRIRSPVLYPFELYGHIKNALSMGGFKPPTQGFPSSTLSTELHAEYQLESHYLSRIPEYLLFEQMRQYHMSTFFTPIIDRQYLYIMLLIKG